MAIVYFPVVKAKTAEWRALGNVDWSSSPSCPLVEIVPIPKRKVAPTEGEWLAEIHLKLSESCSSGTILVDPHLLQPTVPGGGSEASFEYFAANQEQVGPRIAPVVRLGSKQDVLKAAKRLSEVSSAGAAIRILEGELSSSVVDGGTAINARLSDILSTLSVDRSEVDLIIDLGAMSWRSSLDLYVNGLLAAVPLIEEVKAFRYVVIVGSSAPAMNNVAKFDMVAVPRTEFGVFTSFSSRDKSGARLAFGDYVGFAPDLPAGEARTKHPALRYSREEDLAIVRREAERGAGFSIFTAVCEFIVAQPWYKGSDYSWGDFYINEVAAGRTSASGGGSTAWRAAAVNHHITITAQQLAMLP